MLLFVIRSDTSYKLIFFLQNEIESITFDVFMPHTKPITIGINYRPPNQSISFDIFGENLPKFNTSYREIYLGNFNVYLGGFKSSNNNQNLNSFTKRHMITELCSV